MLAAVITLVTSAVLAVPCEYHIDFADFPMGREDLFDYRLVAWDGKVYDSGIGLGPAANPNAIRQLFWTGPKQNDWRGEFVGQTVLVVRGSKKGAIRSVEVTGTGWKPAVRWVPLLPAPKK